MKKAKEPRAYQCPTCGALHEEAIPALAHPASKYLDGLRMALEMIEARLKTIGGKLSSFEPAQELGRLAAALRYEVEIQEKVGKPLGKKRVGKKR